MASNNNSNRNQKDNGTRRQYVSSWLTKMQGRLEEADAKASITEYIRLAQLEKELEEEEFSQEPKGAGWVDHKTSQDSDR